MIRLSIKHDLDRLARSLKDVRREQIPFAASVAINETTKRVERAEQREIGRGFDRPKPQTVKATYVKRSTKRNLTATVGLKERINGVPASEYLLANIQGGARVDKRSERLLKGAGILPVGMQTAPGKAARLDAYGNMSRGQIVQILSYFRTFGTKLSSARSAKINRSAKTLARVRNRAPYFVVPLQDRVQGLYPGIWQRNGDDIQPVLMFVHPGQYRAIYNFAGIAEKEVRDSFEEEFSKAYAKAAATAR